MCVQQLKICILKSYMQSILDTNYSVYSIANKHKQAVVEQCLPASCMKLQLQVLWSKAGAGRWAVLQSPSRGLVGQDATSQSMRDLKTQWTHAQGRALDTAREETPNGSRPGNTLSKQSHLCERLCEYQLDTRSLTLSMVLDLIQSKELSCTSQ